MNEYDPKKIEEKWRKIWLDQKTFETIDDSTKEKLYALVEFPYPSGDGLHVGHTRSYSALDAYSRKKRLEGYNVLYPIGYDAFGLPTENTAIKEGKKPQQITLRNVAVFRQQMQKMGFSFDWSREINTTDSSYYRWTQWIFLQFYKHGMVNGKLIKIADDNNTTHRLAYQDEIPINWCPSCKTGLANEEVVAGLCERCQSQVEKRRQKQWLLRITAYADRLIDDLKTVDYPESVATSQINWIGRSEGSNIIFDLKDSREKIDVYTTRADTLFGCTWVVLAPEHELISKLKSNISNLKEVEEYIIKSQNKSDLERTELQKEKTGVELKGVKAINPINGEEVAVWVADYVLGHYGTGAVMAVPAHDQRDFDFAKKYGIEIIEVISLIENQKSKIKSQPDCALIEYGVLMNSDGFDGLSSGEAKKQITEKLKESDHGDFTINYKLRDWIFSRQHYWGEPIPLIHCEKCGIVPVPEDQLPVILPDVEKYHPTNTGESPLAEIIDWVNTTCPKCDGMAKRETDTMPNWAGSSWYFLRYLDPKNDQEFASREKMDYWMPVDVYNGGMEHTTLHLLYSRFWYKFLADLKLVQGAEPYNKRISHGMILGADHQKMSKSFGNVINPDSIVEKYGADTLRTYILFIGPYNEAAVWNSSSIGGVDRFLKRFWQLLDFVSNDETIDLKRFVNRTIKKISEDFDSFHFNTAVSGLMEMANFVSKEKMISKDSMTKIIQLLYPIAPHISAEMYGILVNKDITASKWPSYDSSIIASEKINIAIQINGKVRDQIEVSPDESESKIKEITLASEKTKGWIPKSGIKKFIYVKGKIVSIVV